MHERHSAPTPPSSPDGAGVRVIEKARTRRGSALVWIVLVVVVTSAGLAWRSLSRPASALPAAGVVSNSNSNSTAASETESAAVRSAAARDRSSPPLAQATRLPNGDPNDLANYFQPGDPEPTGAELIGALHDVGIHTGIGAFNPPGTSPPLEGLAVPENFALPAGYVRHHQSTDDGVAIEPILMFAPDVTLHDATGRPIAMPANRVVPPDLAPPGLPVRWVRIARP